MSEYNLVRFGTTYLTDDGTITGRPCRVETSGLDSIIGTKRGNTVKAADGTPYNFIVEHLGQGGDIEFRIPVMTTAVFDIVKGISEAAVGGVTFIEVGVTGETGTFVFNALPLFPTPIRFSGKFRDDRVFDVTVRMTVKVILSQS